MSFTVKNWFDSPSTATPISAAALEDMEDRLSDYTDLLNRTLDINLVDYAGIDLGGGAGTDSTAGLNNAMNAASAAALAIGPSTVARLIFPPKAVIQTDGLLFAPNVYIVGQGARLLKKNNSSGLSTNSLIRTVPTQRIASAAGNGTTVNGDDRVTGLTSPGSIEVDRRITGTGIPANARVKALDGTTLTLTAPATASGTVALQMSATYYGTHKRMGMEDLVLDRNGKTVAAHMVNMRYMEHFRMDRITIENYDIAGVWATAIGGRNIEIKDITILGGTSVTSDGIHLAHGHDIRIIGGYVECGDDACAMGANPSTDVVFAADPESLRRVTVEGLVVKSFRGHCCRIYNESGATGPNNEVTDVRAHIIGQSGILRNGGILIEDGNYPAAGSSQIRNIDVNLQAEIGSTYHDDVNPYGIRIASADRIRVETDLTMTQGAGAAAGFIGAFIEDSADTRLELRCNGLARRWGVLVRDCPRFTLGGHTMLRQTSAGVVGVVEFENCPDVMVEPGVRILDVKDTLSGFVIGSGTTTSGKILHSTVTHAGGATTGYGLSVTGSAFSFLEVMGNDFSGCPLGANTGSLFALNKVLVRDNRGILDYPQETLYRRIISGRNRFDAAGAQTAVLSEYIGGVAGGSSGAFGMIYLDPAEYTAAGTSKLNIRGEIITNATAPTVNFTLGLYPVTPAGGGAGVVALTLGTVVSGSTLTFTAPALTTATTGTSNDFVAPAAGHYTLACVISGAMAVASAVMVRASLMARAV